MAYAEPPYWVGGPNGESPTAAGLNIYSDNLAALIDLLQYTVNSASNTKNQGAHPQFAFSHSRRWLMYKSESSDNTGTISGIRENEGIEEEDIVFSEVRLPYAAEVGFFDIDSVSWMVAGRQYVVVEVDFAQEIDDAQAG